MSAGPGRTDGADRGGKPGDPGASKGGPSGDPVPPMSSMPAPTQPTAPLPGPSARRPDRALQDVWVERLRAGDAEALREVVQAFGERLTAVVCGVLRDRDAVEDVVQETFTKAWYRIRSFKGGSSLYTWLYRVAVNAAKDHLKSRRRRPASSLDELPGRTSMRAPSRPLVEGLERRELRTQVRAAIARLPHRFRTVLALREIEGMTYNEIAEVLGLSLGTVESRLFRARGRLRALLAADQPPEGDTP